jgi:hypothetical protein
VSIVNTNAVTVNTDTGVVTPSGVITALVCVRERERERDGGGGVTHADTDMRAHTRLTLTRTTAMTR